MTMLLLVIPLAFLLAAAGVWAFIWAVRGGQYDDLETPAVRMLHADEPRTAPRETPGNRDSA